MCGWEVAWYCFQAESWMREQAQKEGWAKASKLHGRNMSQGLIGLLVDKDAAAIVEVSSLTLPFNIMSSNKLREQSFSTY